MNVFGLINQLQIYANSAPGNGNAQICLRGEDGETCFPHFSGMNFKGGPGEHFFVLAPEQPGKFKAVDRMKLV